MFKSDEFLEERIVWRAKRHTFPSKTIKPYEEVEMVYGDKIKELLFIRELGRPVLFFKGEKKTWTILCTRGIIFKSEKTINSIVYAEIDNHTVGDDPFNEFSGSNAPSKTFRKSRQHQILLRTKESQVFTINSSRGMDVYALYNILIMMLRMTGLR